MIGLHTAEFVSVLDQDGHWIAISPACHTVLGYDPVELSGTTPLRLVHPDDRATLLAHWTALSATDSAEVTCRFWHAQGSWRSLETSSIVVTRGDARLIIASSRDISGHAEIERQLRMAQKLGSIGQLSSGITHEFRNLLMTIAWSAEETQYALPGGHAAQSELVKICRAIKRADTLTRQLLMFAHKPIREPHVLVLNTLILEMNKLLHRVLGEHIALCMRPSDDLCWVYADPAQLDQVILNLALNARDAMPEGGTLTIETANVTLNEGDCAQAPNALSGDYVLLTVRDTGSGMLVAVQARIFEPFFTTKAPGAGTGLGLSMCHEIIAQHGGQIRVESALGQGTCFKIYFPRIAARSGNGVEAVSDSRTNDLPRGQETILLVEDEDLVRGLIGQQLRELGYTVLEAEHGVAALRIEQEYGEQTIDLLLTDVMLPQLGGDKLAALLKERRPCLKLLAMSGYPIDSEKVLLHKPFSRSVLARTVRQVLDEDTHQSNTPS